MSPNTSAHDAGRLWGRCAVAASRAVCSLSIPIVHHPQAEIADNPYAVHVEEDWDHPRVLRTFPGVQAWSVGAEVGVYERRTG